MIIDIIKEDDHYLVFYQNGDPKGKKKYWNELSVSEKLEISDFYRRQAEKIIQENVEEKL